MLMKTVNKDRLGVEKDQIGSFISRFVAEATLKQFARVQGDRASKKLILPLEEFS